MKDFKSAQRNMFLLLWVTYATFYLCRVNMSVAMPYIGKEFSLDKTMLGMISSALLLSYAIGQFVNGQLNDKWAKSLISVGIFGSAILNLTFPLSNNLNEMILFWGLNGIFQSMGWSATVKIMANWYPPESRSKWSGILGSCYQIGNAASWILSGFLAAILGWRWAFVLPAIIFAISGVNWHFRAKQSPEEVGFKTVEGYDDSSDTHLGFRYTLGALNLRVWIIGFSFLALDFVRYGFIVWIPTFLYDIGIPMQSVALKSAVLPIAGSVGAVVSGYFTRKFFEDKCTRLAGIFTLLLGVFVLIFPMFSQWNLPFLALVGFLIYGPHVLMVATLPQQLGTRKASASVTGFIDCLGYLGASVVSLLSGYLIDVYGWNSAFIFWAIGAFCSAGLMLVHWNYKLEKRRYA